MPKRLLSDGPLTSDRINALSLEAELFFYRLLMVVDDFGRFDARPIVLRAKCFPMRTDSIRPEEVQGWADELARVGLIQFYEVDGKHFLFMAKWDQHQRIRAKTPKYPDPPQIAASGGELLQKAAVVEKRRREAKTYAETRITPRRVAARFQSPVYSPEFEAWWDAYPFKRGKKAKAAELYSDWLAAGTSHEALYAAATGYAAKVRYERTESRFVMHAETMLAAVAQPWRGFVGWSPPKEPERKGGSASDSFTELAAATGLFADPPDRPTPKPEPLALLPENPPRAERSRS